MERLALQEFLGVPLVEAVIVLRFGIGAFWSKRYRHDVSHCEEEKCSGRWTGAGLRERSSAKVE